MWAMVNGKLCYTVNGRRRWDGMSVVTHPGMVHVGKVFYCADTQKMTVCLPDGSMYTHTSSPAGISYLKKLGPPDLHKSARFCRTYSGT